MDDLWIGREEEEKNIIPDYPYVGRTVGVGHLGDRVECQGMLESFHQSESLAQVAGDGDFLIVE